MKTYIVAIDVKKAYHVSIEANSEDEAFKLANEMPTTAIYEQGTLIDVETTVLGVDEDTYGGSDVHPI